MKTPPYMRPRLRSAYLSIKRNMKRLWTFYDYKDKVIPNTNNGLEAVFADIKSKVRAHSGLTRKHRMKLIDEYIHCHHRRSRRRSEGSGVPHWFSTLAATGDSKGNMHPDDATGCVYHGSSVHISHPSSASVRADAASTCIGESGKLRRDVDKAASLRTDPSIYALYGIICAQRRQSGNVSAHRPHIKGCCFGRTLEQIPRCRSLRQ